MSVGLPAIWTASPAEKMDANGKWIKKTFFDRAVITNVPVNSYFRLWILYGLVWAVFLISMTAVYLHYKAVRSDEFRSLTFLGRVKQNEMQPQRFMPSRLTIAIHGIDRTMTDSTILRAALGHFFEESQIACINLVLNYNEAFQAQQRYTKAIEKVQKMYRNIERMYSPKKHHSCVSDTLSFYVHNMSAHTIWTRVKTA